MLESLCSDTAAAFETREEKKETMTIDELRSYLSGYHDCMLEIEALEHSLEGMRCAGSGDAGGSSRTTVQRYDAIIDRIDKLSAKAQDIIDFIFNNFEGRERVVLYYLYIDCMDANEIADRLDVSVSTIRKEARGALDLYLHLHGFI